MHKTTVLMLSLITAVALVMLPACGAKPSQKIAETAAAKAAEIASGGKAKVDIGSNVDLSGLPANLRYPGAKGLASWTANQDSTKGTYYTLESSDPAAGVNRSSPPLRSATGIICPAVTATPLSLSAPAAGSVLIFTANSVLDGESLGSVNPKSAAAKT